MIRVVGFMGGVGNQLFQYCLYNSFQQKGNAVFFMDRTGQFASIHNGLEVNKYFDVNMRKVPLWLYYCLRPFARFTTSTEENFKESAVFFHGYWQDKKYIPTPLSIKFKSLPLSPKNEEVLRCMQNSESVSLHVRRGDYLSPLNVGTFGGICTEAYYQQAIAIIRKHYTNPKFFIFSDDIAWCRSHLDLKGATYIDWNTGEDSIYDMYLMANSKANVIANSTFSFWGAMLSRNENVVYPKHWYANMPAPEIFPDVWIGI